MPTRLASRRTRLGALAGALAASALAGCAAPAPAPVIERSTPAGGPAVETTTVEAARPVARTQLAAGAGRASPTAGTGRAPPTAGAGAAAPAPARARRYTVRPGDTLYSIAWRHGVDYRALGELNRIPAPYLIRPGQTLRIAGAPAPAKAPTPAPDRRWRWPLAKRAGAPSTEPSHRGLALSAPIGTPVRAARAGTVVYAGNGLPGYGNLLIVKHDGDWLSAYGHNQRLLAQEGQAVSAGQPIALSGRDAEGEPALYFEIRRRGRQVDAARLLQKP